MQGIYFITDAQGRKVAVQIDLEQQASFGRPSTTR